MYGDPHMVTLDLHKYTFNGKGEFILIQELNNSFTLQGRMVETTNDNNNIVPATVFSALVAKQNDSDTVQLQLDNFTNIIALVNGEEIDFSELTEQEFNNVTVADLGNNTFTATFSGGPFVKVQEENEIISVMLVSLPSSYRNRTQGLMGNYNGDTADDLTPRGRGQALQLNSTLRDIHELFGVTCKCEYNNNYQ